MASAMKFVCLVLMVLAVTAPLTQAAITCVQVSSSLARCLGYLQKGGPVPADCCSGVKSLNDAATTTPDRQAACNCLKSAAGSIPGIDVNNAASLPGKCGVNIPYKISPSTDCRSVK